MNDNEELREQQKDAEIERLTADYAAATHLLADRDAQIERLKAELATLRASAASVQADQRAEIDRANVVIDELREDAQRMDHLDALMLRTAFQNSRRPTERVGSDLHMGGGRASLYVRDLFGSVIETESGYGASVREAIDAARALRKGTP